MNVFEASSIKCYEEDGVLVVAVGDDPVDPRNYMIITRLDDEDNLTVDDGIGFQTADAQYEMAGAIKKVLLDENGLRVDVKPEFVGHFGGVTTCAKFNNQTLCQHAHIAYLRNALRAIFDGSKIEFVC
ncbi:hypothetical protein [Pseudomonas sp. PSKL.D1]|uniref:hypothetical protein n=1 Tax=Pseudomonas sp. PSKL.D1 TaxID=3029060 RepID=UPI0023817B46|nr:hypothetical protein [Pseudomonas sp. PSKL.D1]WDY60295.1 hypothetical protein PVV54_11925 [Pseudomonas sp. PSKL.D1]